MYELIYFGIGLVLAVAMWLTDDSRDLRRPGDDAAKIIISIMLIFMWGFLVPFVFVFAAWESLRLALERRKQRLLKERNKRL